MCRIKPRLWTVITMVLVAATQVMGQGGMIGGGGMGGGTVIPSLNDDYLASWSSAGILSKVLCAADTDATGNSMVQQTFILEGQVSVLDANNLLGLSLTAENIKAKDHLNRTLSIQQQHPSYCRPHYQPLAMTDGAAIEMPFTLVFGGESATEIPAALTQVQWLIKALYAKRLEEFQIPWSVSEQWTELDSQTDCWIRQAQCSNGEFEYVLQIRFCGEDPTLMTNYRSPMRVPLEAVLKIEVLDGQGQVLQQSQIASTDIHWSSDNIYTCTGKGSCTTETMATALRLTLACDLQEEPITLTLTDVPLPAM